MNETELREEISSYWYEKKYSDLNPLQESAIDGFMIFISNHDVQVRLDELDNIPWKRADKYGINSPYVTKEWLSKRKAELSHKEKSNE